MTTKNLKTTVLLLSFSAAAVLASPTLHAKDKCYTIDLKTGVVPAKAIPFISIVQAPIDTNQDGYFETVLKLKVNAPRRSLPFTPRAVKFMVSYDKAPSGLSVNIGDSATNNGHSGDGATQSNDAEVQIGSADPAFPYDTLFAYGHDNTPAARGTIDIARISNVVKAGETVTLTAADSSICYENKAFPLVGGVKSPWLFALKGQPDTEGPVNYDIYAGFNRAITDRIGSGVAKVKVCWAS